MAIKFEITVTNKWLYSLIVFGILLVLGVGVYAYTQSIPNPGHGADSVWVSTSSGENSLQNVLNNGFPRKDCVWREVPINAMQWTCNEKEFVAGIAYEPAEWTTDVDTHIYPEVSWLYCCKMG